MDCSHCPLLDQQKNINHCLSLTASLSIEISGKIKFQFMMED